jgi:uncharacterized membrane protein
MMRWIAWALFTLAVAAAVHWVSVRLAPDIVMSRVMSAMAAKGTNTITHVDRATAASRTVVKPSPDLLYSHCLFDVSRAAVKITTAAPANTYWSVALYADNTDNFFALNDRQAEGKAMTIILIGQGHAVAPPPEGTVVIGAPTAKGLVIFRTLIDDEARLAELDAARRAAKCEPMYDR